MRKLLLILIILSSVAFAQQTGNNWDEICEFRDGMAGTLGTLIVISVILQGILIIYGLYLIITDKKKRMLGVLLLFVPVIIPIILSLIMIFGDQVVGGIYGVEAYDVVENCGWA